MPNNVVIYTLSPWAELYFRTGDRPRRKGYRPWRNRAIVYTLIETGMRRAEVTSIDLSGIDYDRHTLLITEKGGRQRKCPVTKQELKAITDYLEHERGNDAELFPESPALFLPADTIVNSRGRLLPSLINRLWNDLCVSARAPAGTGGAMKSSAQPALEEVGAPWSACISDAAVSS